MGFPGDLRVLDEVDSTSDHARRLFLSDAPPPLPLWIVARRQTAGRGRGTNTWWSDSGSLTTTLVLDPAAIGLRADHLPRVALAVATAVVDAAEGRGLVPRDLLGIRWPNDVETRTGLKLGGILPEPFADAGGRNLLAIGIGVNVSSSFADAPPAVRAMATSLQEVSGRPIGVEGYLPLLMASIAGHLADLAADRDTLVTRWRALDLLRGREVRVDQMGRIIRGTVRDIDARGRLLLASDDGTVLALAGGRVLREEPPR